MVRFRQNALVIEIPCHEGNVADYYTGLQNALFGVYWLATAKNNESEVVSSELNWIAAYLGPAIAELEPVAKQALNGLAATEGEERVISPEYYTNEEILAFLRELPVSRFEWLLQQFDKVNNK